MADPIVNNGIEHNKNKKLIYIKLQNNVRNLIAIESGEKNFLINYILLKMSNFIGIIVLIVNVSQIYMIFDVFNNMMMLCKAKYMQVDKMQLANSIKIAQENLVDIRVMDKYN